MTNVGYARVSTKDQELQLQLDALKAAGVKPRDTYTDKASGKTSARPGLDKALARLRPGDTLVVWKLDRLGRPMVHLVTTVAGLGARGIGFKSLTEAIDTTTNGAAKDLRNLPPPAELRRPLLHERP